MLNEIENDHVEWDTKKGLYSGRLREELDYVCRGEQDRVDWK